MGPGLGPLHSLAKSAEAKPETRRCVLPSLESLGSRAVRLLGRTCRRRWRRWRAASCTWAPAAAGLSRSPAKFLNTLKNHNTLMSRAPAGQDMSKEMAPLACGELYLGSCGGWLILVPG